MVLWCVVGYVVVFLLSVWLFTRLWAKTIGKDEKANAVDGIGLLFTAVMWPASLLLMLLYALSVAVALIANASRKKVG